MAHSTFISYKYSETKDLRDRIIDSLGDDARYYRGENNDSKDISDRSNDAIREYLKDMIYGTSVTIALISPNMTNSAWISWELEYALKDIKRGDRSSHSNGIVGVIMGMPDSGWIRKTYRHPDGDVSSSFSEQFLPKIITDNRLNQKPTQYVCKQCMTVDALTGSYVSLVDEAQFLEDPNKYIDNAFDKSQNLDNYDIVKVANISHAGIL